MYILWKSPLVHYLVKAKYVKQKWYSTDKSMFGTEPYYNIFFSDKVINVWKMVIPCNIVIQISKSK